MRRRHFRKIRWLAADMNVSCHYTLDAVQSIVTHAEVNIRGMLLTLKLPQWKLAENVPAYLDRIRSWGYNQGCLGNCNTIAANFASPHCSSRFGESRRGAASSRR